MIVLGAPLEQSPATYNLAFYPTHDSTLLENSTELSKPECK